MSVVFDEARVTINGVELSVGQVIAIRVAVTEFHADLTPRRLAMLGKVGPLYKAHVEDVLALLTSGMGKR